VKTGREIGIQPRVIAEIAKSQMGQMHAEELAVPPATVSHFLVSLTGAFVIRHLPWPFSGPGSAHNGP
jgi:hypothetical protein